MRDSRAVWKVNPHSPIFHSDNLIYSDASGTTSDSEIAAAGEAGSSSTKKASAKRNRMVRNILNNLN